MDGLRLFAMSLLQFPCDEGWMVTVHMAVGSDQVTHCRHALAPAPAMALRQVLAEEPAFTRPVAMVRRALGVAVSAEERNLQPFSLTVADDGPGGWRAQIDLGEPPRTVRIAPRKDLGAVLAQAFHAAAELGLSVDAVGRLFEMDGAG